MHCERHILSSLYRRQVYGACKSRLGACITCSSPRIPALTPPGRARLAWQTPLPRGANCQLTFAALPRRSSGHRRRPDATAPVLVEVRAFLTDGQLQA